MRCNHCGSTGGSERTVDFRERDACTLTLCDACVRDFERDDTVLSVRIIAAQ